MAESAVLVDQPLRIVDRECVDPHRDQLRPAGGDLRLQRTVRPRHRVRQPGAVRRREELGLPEDRRHERIVPRNPRSLLCLSDGSEHPVRIIDISLSGAAVSSDLDLPMNTPVRLGSTPARIVRRVDGGYAVEFRFPLSADLLYENLEL